MRLRPLTLMVKRLCVLAATVRWPCVRWLGLKTTQKLQTCCCGRLSRCVGALLCKPLLPPMPPSLLLVLLMPLLRTVLLLLGLGNQHSIAT